MHLLLPGYERCLCATLQADAAKVTRLTAFYRPCVNHPEPETTPEMRYLGLAVVLSLSLTGCAGLTGSAPPVDRVSFDRGAFALGYADLIGPLLKACGTTPGTPDCAKLALLEGIVLAVDTLF